MWFDRQSDAESKCTGRWIKEFRFSGSSFPSLILCFPYSTDGCSLPSLPKRHITHKECLTLTTRLTFLTSQSIVVFQTFMISFFERKWLFFISICNRQTFTLLLGVVFIIHLLVPWINTSLICTGKWLSSTIPNREQCILWCKLYSGKNFSNALYFLSFNLHLNVYALL
jgi:hypothetical protein